MRSVWLCSRNDIIANGSVLIAALAVWFTRAQWPDLAIGVAIVALFLRSALHVIRDAIGVYAARAVSLSDTSTAPRVPPTVIFSLPKRQRTGTKKS